MTIGVYGYDADSFEKAVVDSKPDIFVDVRLRRGVRGHNYAFANSQHLQDMLAKNDIPYIHKKELAPAKSIVQHEGLVDEDNHIARHERKELSDKFVADYTKQVLYSFDAKAFMASLGDDKKRVLLMCVERTAEACHRGLLAEAIHKQLDWKRKDLEP